MSINIEKILTESASGLAQKMGIEVAEVPPAEALRYFRFDQIPFLLFFIAKKTHRVSIKAVGEQYERQTGQTMTYEAVRHLVGKYYDEVERVKMMQTKSIK